MTKREAKAAVGEIALKVWDALLAHHEARLDSMTVTDVMRASDLSRAEIRFGLRELAQGGWVERGIFERDKRMVEAWGIVSRDHPHANAAE